MEIYRTLEALQRPVTHWDDFLVFIAVQRLDSESIKAWEHHIGPSKDPPSWKQFSEFLISRLLSLQAYEKSRGGKLSVPTHQRAIKAHYQDKSSQDTSSDTLVCTFCSSNHRTVKCPTYSTKTVPQRRDLIIKHKLCFNCLKPHRSSACRSTNRCLKCARKHHTSIHEEGTQAHTTKKSEGKPIPPAATTSISSSKTTPQVLHTLSEPELPMTSVLLATATVLMVSPRGETSKARVLIDQGSEVSLICERMVQRLRLPRTSATIPLVGIGGQKSTTTNGQTSFKLKSLSGSDFECSISAHILPKLTASLPSTYIEKRTWTHLEGLTLADPDFQTRGAIDLILGADAYGHIIDEGLIKGPLDAPVAQLTKFGWIISGPTSGSTSSSSLIHGYHVSCDDPLHSLLQRFWELDEIPASNSPPLSVEEQHCENHFSTTHMRDEQGRYIVRLPFKHPPEQLGDSKAKATRLIHKLFNTFLNDDVYANAYTDFITEYANLHMVLIPDNSLEPPTAYYLPHHGIWKENSLTTKLRVVFNGSSRTTSGLSLNHVLHVGSKLQRDLFDVLIWFRQFRYVFSSDVEKMYRQILVHPDDQKYQRILWLDHAHHLITYQLSTVTYGLACAPFIALRTFSQLIKDEGSKYPQASPVNQRSICR